MESACRQQSAEQYQFTRVELPLTCPSRCVPLFLLLFLFCCSALVLICCICFAAVLLLLLRCLPMFAAAPLVCVLLLLLLLLLDVSITHPCASSFVIAAAVKCMAAADERVAVKHGKYDPMAALKNALFFALVMETMGGMAGDIDAYIMTCISDMRQTRIMQPHEEQRIIEHAFATMAFALWRGNAELALTPIHTAPPRDTAPQHHTYARRRVNMNMRRQERGAAAPRV